MSEAGKRLTVVQMNDSHAYFDLHEEWFWQDGKMVYRPAGGYARIATLIRQMREECGDSLLFCDNGDTLNGTMPAIRTKGAAMVPVLNALGIDAMTVHWEFGFGPPVLAQRAVELNFPILAVNVYDQKTNQLMFQPFVIKQIGGLKVGLIGIASNIVDKTMPPAFSAGVRFTLGREELPGIVDALRNRDGVDLVVLISHLGFPQDMKLLSEVPGIDLCLSGHTHNRLACPVRQGKTLVIQSGCHGSFIGRIDLDVSQRAITGYRHQLIEVDSGIVPDPGMTGIIRHELAPFQDELDTVVGETATALNRATMLETTADNFLLAALLESSDAELAFSNGWRYGAPIAPGPVAMNDLYNIIPMNPPLVTVTLSGEELVEMLEENLERTFSSDPYEQMGGYVKRALGLKAFIKIENPAGQRIQKIFVGNDSLDRSRTYRAVFVTEQGVARKYGSERQELPIRAVDAMRTYLAKHIPLSVALHGTFIPV